jgi:hypothetical protein
MARVLFFAIPNVLALGLFLIMEPLIAGIINFVVFFIMILVVTAYVIVPDSEAKHIQMEMKNV